MYFEFLSKKTEKPEIHPKKTKILSNVKKRKGAESHTEISIGTQKVQILRYEEATKYLGCMFSFSQTIETELDHRINLGWKKFFAFKKQLCHPHYTLHQRLRLFDAIITPSVLYGCASWTLKAEMVQKLKKTQRMMLRKIFRKQRCPQESWVDWLKSTAAQQIKLMETMGIRSWVELHYQRKWAWAKRTFDTYPSAYANMAASKYCKDPSYARGSKKKKK